jgi:hypothetical protein
MQFFPVISQTDTFSISLLSDSVLKIIGQCDVKHIMTLPIKTIMSVLKVLNFTTAVILYILSAVVLF